MDGQQPGILLGPAMKERSSNPLTRAISFLADLWRTGGRRYRPEQHYLRGRPSGLSRQRR